MFINPYNYARGVVCIVRKFDNKDVAFKVVGDRSFKEWSGCFSIL
jgi:hypothetical protein